MKRGLTILALWPLLASQAHGATAANAPRVSIQRAHVQGHPLDLRVFEDSRFDPGAAQHSDMAAETDVSPGAAFGFRIIRAAPKSPSTGDWRIDGSVRRTRAPAVSFRLKF